MSVRLEGLGVTEANVAQGRESGGSMYGMVADSVIEWHTVLAMRSHGVAFRHAVKLLKAEPFPVHAGNKAVWRVRKLEMAVDTSTDDARVLEQVVSHYHETLKTSPEALEFLARQGLHWEACRGCAGHAGSFRANRTAAVGRGVGFCARLRRTLVITL